MAAVTDHTYIGVLSNDQDVLYVIGKVQRDLCGRGRALSTQKDQDVVIACYNGVGSEKFTASELYRCPNLSYNEDVLRERSIAGAERSYAQTVLRHLHCSVRLTQVELSADKNVAVHSCHKAS